MNKKLFFTISAGLILSISACSNQGAYSEEEKKSQDSSDQERIEDKFKELEGQGTDSGSIKMNDQPPAPAPAGPGAAAPGDKPGSSNNNQYQPPARTDAQPVSVEVSPEGKR